jgi:hypothetical protein
MPLNRENRRRQITLNVTPYIYDVDAVALSLINQFKTYGADPEVTKLDDYKLSLTFRESDELTYEVACQKILWNQYVQDIEQKNVTTNIELLKKMLDPYFDSPVVANVNEVLGDGKGQLDGISPSAFSDGEVLWADGKPMPHPSYSIADSEVRVPAGGPMPLSRDLDKDAETSTITSSWKFSHEVIPYPTDDEQAAGHLIQHHGYDRDELRRSMEFLKQDTHPTIKTLTDDHRNDHELYERFLKKQLINTPPNHDHEPNGIWDEHIHE